MKNVLNLSIWFETLILVFISTRWHFYEQLFQLRKASRMNSYKINENKYTIQLITISFRRWYVNYFEYRFFVCLVLFLKVGSERTGPTEILDFSTVSWNIQIFIVQIKFVRTKLHFFLNLNKRSPVDLNNIVTSFW